MNTTQKTVVLIDGSNASAIANSLGIKVDWKLFRDYCTNYWDVLRMKYYSAVYTDEEGHAQIQPLLDWLECNGYSVVSKQAREYKTEDGGKRIKGNMDVEIVADMFMLAPRIGHIVLVSGDNDFTYAIKALQDVGIVVSIMSTLKGSFQHAGNRLRRQADNFIDIADVGKNFVQQRVVQE